MNTELAGFMKGELGEFQSGNRAGKLIHTKSYRRDKSLLEDTNDEHGEPKGNNMKIVEVTDYVYVFVDMK